MEKNSDEWEKWCLLEASEKAPMPGDWGKISDFRQLLIIRALKPGRITNALQVRASHLLHAAVLLTSAEPVSCMQNFCEKAMGSRYVNQDAFSPSVVMSEASSSTPIFFILFPGYSPSKEIEAYAREVNHTVENGKLTLISMGQVSCIPAPPLFCKMSA